MSRTDRGLHSIMGLTTVDASAVADEPRTRGLRGIPLPAWIIAGALAIVLIIGLAVILPRIGRDPSPFAAQPGGPGGIGVIGTGTVGPSGAASSGAPSAGAPSAGPGGVPTPTGTRPAGTAPPGLEVGLAVRQLSPLDLQALGLLDLLDLLGLDGWRVTVTIHNPADVEQAWTSVSVHVQSGNRIAVSLTDGIAVTKADTVVCVAPGAPTSIPPGADETVEFVVRSRTAPTGPAIDDPVCDE